MNKFRKLRLVTYNHGTLSVHSSLRASSPRLTGKPPLPALPIRGKTPC